MMDVWGFHKNILSPKGFCGNENFDKHNPQAKLKLTLDKATLCLDIQYRKLRMHQTNVYWYKLLHTHCNYRNKLLSYSKYN